MEEKKVLWARVFYKSVRRGLRETELLFMAFNDQIASHFDEKTLIEYEEILDKPDNDVMDAIYSNEKTYNSALGQLRDFVSSYRRTKTRTYKKAKN